jgi:hypothetical protein
LSAASLDGAPVTVNSAVEAGRFVYTAVVTVGPGQTATLRLELAGPISAPGGRYALDVRAQPTVVPGQVSVTITGRRGAYHRTFAADQDQRVVVPVGG